MSEQPRAQRNAVAVGEALGRLGLSHTALSAMIAAGLDEAGAGLIGPPIASAVAQAIESNNAEIHRQLMGLLGDLERLRNETSG